MKKLKTFPLKSGIRQGCLLTTLLFNRVLEVLATLSGKTNIKGTHSGEEEVKQSLFGDDPMLHKKSPKDSTKKLFKLIYKLYLNF